MSRLGAAPAWAGEAEVARTALAGVRLFAILDAEQQTEVWVGATLSDLTNTVQGPDFAARRYVPESRN